MRATQLPIALSSIMNLEKNFRCESLSSTLNEKLRVSQIVWKIRSVWECEVAKLFDQMQGQKWLPDYSWDQSEETGHGTINTQEITIPVQLQCGWAKPAPGGTRCLCINKNHGNKWDFPGGSVVKNMPWKTGDAGSIPGQGTNVPHATEQLSPCTSADELTGCNQSIHVPQWRLSTAKNKNKKNHRSKLLY